MRKNKIMGLILTAVMIMGLVFPTSVLADEKDNLPKVEVGQSATYEAQNDDITPGEFYPPDDFDKIPILKNKTWDNERIFGQDRFETAIAIAEKFCQTDAELGIDKDSMTNYTFKDTAKDKVDTVILATAFNYPDAMCATPLTRPLNAPILLTYQDRLEEKTKAKMESMEIKHVVIVGGEGVVSPAVTQELKAMGIEVEQIGGKDRYETSALIARKLDEVQDVHHIDKFGQNQSRAFLVTGDRWEDSLACSSAATTDGSPILLVPKTVDNPAVDTMHEFCVENGIAATKAEFFGDTVVDIPADVLRKIVPANKGMQDVVYSKNRSMSRVPFANVFLINSRNAMSPLTSYLMTPYCFITRGDDFVDSLTVGSLAAKLDAAVVHHNAKGITASEAFKLASDETQGKAEVMPSSPEDVRESFAKTLTLCGANAKHMVSVGGPTVVPDSADDMFINIWKY